MEVKATGKHIRTSPRKLRLMADLVRGKKVDQALTILKFLPTPSAKDLAKAIQSAAANAENNFEMTPSDLKITKIFDGGRMMKRFRAGPRGRVKPFVKRSSHITVIVKEEE
jgi:large subunit ribosomal protein L22